MFCHQCGHRNPDEARFCSACGATLEVVDDDPTLGWVATADHLTDEHAAVPNDPDEGFAMLIVRRGPGAGSSYLLDTKVTHAGRHPESEIFLDDITVSRRHAELQRADDGSYTVRDAGSLNGTYVNRQRVEEAPLQNGDEVQIGKYRLVFVAHDPARASHMAG
jgi:pSer/pThr/pTyr-binding forkhead associated (FHA) protein